MKNGKLGLKYEVYIAVPTERVWEALTEGSATKQYFYGCSVRSTFKKGAPISGRVWLTCALAGTLAQSVLNRRAQTTWQTANISALILWQVCILLASMQSTHQGKSLNLRAFSLR